MDNGEAWIQLGAPALCPKRECALLLSWCVGRVLRPGRDTCIGRELNLICAFFLQDCTCGIEEDDRGGKRAEGRVLSKDTEFAPGPLRSERAEGPEGPRRQSP